MAPWGRPLEGVVGRNERRAWHERQMREWEELQRFQELDSEYDVRQGVGLRTGAYRGGFAGDELQFTGFDIGSGMNRGPAYDEFSTGDEYEFLGEEDDCEGRTGAARQLAMRHKEELLVESALERIHRARLMGKTNVKLSREELDALERRGLQPQQQSLQHQRDVPMARTPVKANTKEPKTSIGSTSGDKSTKRSGRGFFSSPATKPKGSKQSRKGTPSSDDNTPSYDNPAPAPPGFVVPGPGGSPAHTPLGYYTPRAYSPTPSPSRRDSPTNSRSASAARRHNTPPTPSQYIAYRPPGGRYFSQPENFRPSSSSRGSPTRSLPDDPDWVPRSRSASTANLYPDQSAYQIRHGNPPNFTGSPSRSDYINRRHVSGPAEVAYSTLRRVLPSVGISRAGASEPALLTRTSSGLSQQMDVGDSSDDDDDDQGAQVEILPDDRGGYGVRGSSAGGSGGRQRIRKP